MTKPCLAALAVLLVGLTACSGSYKNRIQGSYNSSYKRGIEAARAEDYERAAEHYAFAAQSGHPKALIAYGRLFAKGAGVDPDPARAAALFQEAYDKTSNYKAKAALELARVYMKGGDGPSGAIIVDEVRAKNLLVLALDRGESRAASSLGKIYDKGLGVDPDPTKAIFYYQQAAANDANAAHRLAILLVKAGASKADVAEVAGRAVSQFEARAKAGDQGAWLKLADIFSKNRIVDADPARATAYLRNLPEDGDPTMNMRLARIYRQTGDHQERKRRLRLAADAGDSKAQTELAKLFLKAGTADTNGPDGRYYAERAIGQNNEVAMVHLGRALLRGNVLERDPLAGETLLRRASERGQINATVALGRSILSGDIQGRHPDEGRELLETAAREGSADAMSALGFAYQRGRGLPVNEALALKWLQKAADAGKRDAKVFLQKRQSDKDS